MAKSMPVIPNVTINKALVIRNINRNLFSLHLRFLNFSANSGIFETINQLHIRVVMVNIIVPIFSENSVELIFEIDKIAIFVHSGQQYINPSVTHTSALAGAGSPRNDDVCRMSRLNLASRHAAASGISKAIYDSHDGLARSCIMWKRINPGAMPEVTRSAKESSSLPIGDETFSKRATIPSKKSNSIPKAIKMAAYCRLPLTAC